MFVVGIIFGIVALTMGEAAVGREPIVYTGLNKGIEVSKPVVNKAVKDIKNVVKK